jgi:hypothetical protein
MSLNQASRPRRDTLEDIRKEHDFSTFLIVAWGIIELNLNQVILREHNLSGWNPKADSFIRSSVHRKLEHQLKLGLLSQEENEIIQIFKKKRNRYFHDLGVFVLNLAETEKQEIALNAFKAVDVTYSLFDRVFDSKNNQRWIDASESHDK